MTLIQDQESIFIAFSGKPKQVIVAQLVPGPCLLHATCIAFSMYLRQTD